VNKLLNVLKSPLLIFAIVTLLLSASCETKPPKTISPSPEKSNVYTPTADYAGFHDSDYEFLINDFWKACYSNLFIPGNYISDTFCLNGKIMSNKTFAKLVSDSLKRSSYVHVTTSNFSTKETHDTTEIFYDAHIESRWCYSVVNNDSLFYEMCYDMKMKTTIIKHWLIISHSDLEPIFSECAAICDPVMHRAINDSGSVYDHPYTRSDTSYNEGPVYLYKNIPQDNGALPADSIVKNGAKVKCIKMASRGDNIFNSQQYIYLLYKGKKYWTTYSSVWTENEDRTENTPAFSVFYYTFYFKPIHQPCVN
jgi:hypothetical protein